MVLEAAEEDKHPAKLKVRYQGRHGREGCSYGPRGRQGGQTSMDLEEDLANRSIICLS